MRFVQDITEIHLGHASDVMKATEADHLAPNPHGPVSKPVYFPAVMGLSDAVPSLRDSRDRPECPISHRLRVGHDTEQSRCVLLRERFHLQVTRQNFCRRNTLSLT